MYSAVKRYFDLTCVAVAFIIVMAMLTDIVTELDRRAISAAALLEREYTLVIDPGHGGIDGGAIGADGTRESVLNLDIALEMRCIAELFGIRTVLTREDDSAKSDMESYSEHGELVRRADIANSEKNAVFISVHQNIFPTSEPHGFQALYADNDASRALGKIIHESVVAGLDKSNRRVAQPGSKGLYLLKNVNCPAVLLECGFMSNAAELEKLKDTDYQRCLSLLTVSAVIRYIEAV